MVTKTLDVGRALGESREATGVAAEQLQIYGRAIEETNGDAGSFDKVVLRLSKSIGDASNGNKAAQEGFDKLGLSWEDLADKSPDEALKAVVGAANESLNATDGASVKAALLGRAYTNLGGFANLTTSEMTTLTDSVAENAVTMSGDQVTAVDKFDTASRGLRDTIGGLTTGVGSALIPILTKLIDGVQAAIPILKDTFTPIFEALKEVWLELQPTLAQLGTTLTKDLLPALQKIWQAIAPVLIPVMKVWIGLISNNLKTSFQVIAGAISFVAALLTGDFAGAWQAAQKIAQAVMNGIIGVYNNTIGRLPGVSKIDMQTFADNVDSRRQRQRIHNRFDWTIPLQAAVEDAGARSSSLRKTPLQSYCG